MIAERQTSGIPVSYVIACGMVGCGLNVMAVTHGGWWHLFHWLSLSFWAMAAGHAGVGAHVFGKRPNGTLPLWSTAIHLPFLLYSALVWTVTSRFGREPAWNRMNDELMIGRRLCDGELPTGVTNCLDLTAEWDEPAGIRAHTHYVNLPILDASTPKYEALLAALESLKPGTTYIHCAQGHGRTGLVAIMLLAWRGKIATVDEGFALIRNVRPGVALNRYQRKWVESHLPMIAERR